MSQKIKITAMDKNFCQKYCAAWHGEKERGWCGASLLNEYCLWTEERIKRRIKEAQFERGTRRKSR